MIADGEYRERLRRLKLLATDVDGVLTDGSIVYVEGEREAKVFQVRDGSGFHVARLLDLEVLVITARTSEAVARRFAELPVRALHQGVFDKLGVILEAQQELGLEAAETGYIGDDLVDLPTLRHAGLGITPADGHPRLRQEADRVTRARGGRGAFREVVDDIVTAREAWDEVLRDYEERQTRPPSRSR
ncbi:MAG: KdsC family phosphatase [Acidobacteriota bacterium]